RDRLGEWCGWVLVAAAALTPLVGWLAPLGFAVLTALVGALTLPALRVKAKDRPVALALLAALAWAAVSTSWSPYHPKSPAGSTALKLAFYWSAISAARRADPKLVRLAFRVLAWGMALLGLMMIAESVTGGEIYQRLHETFYQWIRPDLARKNLGQVTFVLALLWPLAAAGGIRAGAPAWLVLPMVAGVAAGGVVFQADAPAVSLALSLAVGLAVYRLPRAAPRVLAGVTAASFLVAPAIVWAVRDLADFRLLERDIPLSWTLRVGYWSHALDWIRAQPLRGWGLDASRAFSPGIQLHPHDAPLQIWLELGVVGAVAAAVVWGATLLRLSRRAPDLTAAAAAGSAVVYLLFAAFNFGVWQEWWLALGALVAVLATAAPRLSHRP
ncbi:MAG: O-antigen ligase family protein, partial [Phenylobacterium sp.]